MVRLSYALLSTLLLLCILCVDSAARADEPAQAGPAGPPIATESPSDVLESRFLALKAGGDHAYAQGQWAPAIRAYLDALALRSDPTTHGRLGMIASRTRALHTAAHHLLIAVERNGGSTNAERIAFAAKFASIRPKVCLVHVVVNVISAKLQIPPDIFRIEGGLQKVFVMPGKHNARASADGYEDAAAEFEAPVGGDITVKLELKRIESPPDPPPPPHERIEVLEVPVEPVMFPQISAVVSGGSFAVDKDAMKTEVALGVAISPYGMSSVGVGGNGMIGLRWPRFALGVDMQGLITPASGIGDNDIPGRTSIFTATLLPCVVASVVDVCVLGSVSKLNFDVPDSYALTQTDGWSAGFGARVSARWPFSQRFSALIYAEGAVQLRGFYFRSIDSLKNDGPPDWHSPSVRLTTGIAVSAIISP